MENIDFGKLSKELTTLIEEKFPQKVAAVYLYGSYAKGYARQDSDADVAVLYRDEAVISEETENGIYDIISSVIAKNLKIDYFDVGVVNLNSSQNLILRSHIVNDGIILYEGDHYQRCGFEYITARNYFDNKMFFEDDLRVIISQIKEGTFFDD